MSRETLDSNGSLTSDGHVDVELQSNRLNGSTSSVTQVHVHGDSFRFCSNRQNAEEGYMKQGANENTGSEE